MTTKKINTTTAKLGQTLVYSSLVSLLGVPYAAAQNESFMLEEVTVTARKMEESLQSTPVAVSSLSGDAMSQKGVVSLEDLKAIPAVSLDAAALAPGYALISIRGLSQTGAEPSLDPAVATIINGVYYAKSTNGLVNMFDIETVEVLRGPQGTLFGRNSPAGVVNVRTRRPGDEMAVQVDASYGNLSTSDFRVAADLPITDTLLSRVAVMKRDSDGAYSNSVDGAEDPEQVDLLMGRVAFDYLPNDDLEAKLTLESTRGKGTGGNVKDTSPLDWSVPAVLPILVPGAVSPDPDSDVRNVYSDFTQTENRDANSAILEVDYTTGNYTWTSVTGYFEESNQFYFDVDASPATLLHSVQSWDSDQVSQEFRVASSLDGNVNFIAGVYYLEDHYEKFQDSRLNLGMVTGLPFLSDVTINPLTTADQELSALAAFGQVYIDLSETVSLTLGGRYSKDEKDFVFEFVNGAPVSGIPAGTVVDVDESWENFSPLVSLSWEPTPEIMTYISWSNGFRAGGFNGRATDLVAVQTPYDEESAEAIEVGIKSELFDHRLRLNLAMHYTEYSDLQVVSSKVVDGSPSTFVLNAASSTIQGIELEATALVTESLTITTNIAYQDLSYDEFPGDLNGDGIETDNSDLDIPRAPDWKVGIAADYAIDFDTMGSMNLGLDWTYTAEQELQTVPLEGVTRRGAVHLVDASASWMINETVTLGAFARNLTDEEYPVDAGINDGWGAYQSYAMPRTYGISVSLNY